ncbi:hypothetical protein FKP32DRAFT_1586620 [Trametes sanguinea]|nr:hypothetical protein FKP32DRAFT_1586620 [Trametes sanguinea]
MLFHICSYLKHSDLPEFALVDKLCNEICTPLLYRNVRLLYPRTVVSCLKTLATDPARLSFGRDLAALVHHFIISDYWRMSLGPTDVDPPDYEELLLGSLRLMSNVRTVSCMESLRGLGILEPLLSTPHQAVESVEMRIGTIATSVLSEELRGRLQQPDPLLPKLSNFNIHIGGSQTSKDIFLIRDFIASHAETIRQLAMLSLSTTLFKAVIPGLLSSLPGLQHLEVNVDQLYEPGFGRMSSVKSLTIRDFNLGNALTRQPRLPDTHWPTLEELVCSPWMVHAFLDEFVEPRRPISTLRMDFVTYDRDYGDLVLDFCPMWRDIFRAVGATCYSAVPLKHLCFQALSSHLQRFNKLLPYLEKLESLIVALTENPTPSDVLALGETFIAHLPHLHTLLFSDAFYKIFRRNGAFRFARDLGMQRKCLDEYSTYSAVLRRVAFTTEFEWEKGDDGVWIPSQLPRDEPADVSDGEDDVSDFDDGSETEDDDEDDESEADDDFEDEDEDEADEDDDTWP